MYSSEIIVSYRAAGVFARLCCDGVKNWYIDTFDFNLVLDELVSNFNLKTSIYVIHYFKEKIIY
jgi:hypothetical protein